MTGKADFTPEEWETVLKGSPSAAMIVVTAQRGGTFRESFSIAKVYAEARQTHGESQLLDEIAATKPEIDHTRYHSYEELKEAGLQHLRDAVALLEQKATPQEMNEEDGTELTGIIRVTLTANWTRGGADQSKQIAFYVYRL